jgi:hypothetical protein
MQVYRECVPSERTSSPAPIKPPPHDDDYVDERVLIHAEQSTQQPGDLTPRLSWFYRLVRPRQF